MLLWDDCLDANNVRKVWEAPVLSICQVVNVSQIDDFLPESVAMKLWLRLFAPLSVNKRSCWSQLLLNHLRFSVSFRPWPQGYTFTLLKFSCYRSGTISWVFLHSGWVGDVEWFWGYQFGLLCGVPVFADEICGVTRSEGTRNSIDKAW